MLAKYVHAVVLVQTLCSKATWSVVSQVYVGCGSIWFLLVVIC